MLLSPIIRIPDETTYENEDT